MARPPNLEARTKLLQAARALFARVGVEAARIQDIAEAAGFSKAAFYLYFDSKEAVYASVVGEFFDKLTDVTNRRHAAFHELVARLGPCTEDDWKHGSERLLAFAELDHRYTVEAMNVMWEDRDVLASVLEHTSGERRHLLDQLVVSAVETLTGRMKESIDLGFCRSDLDPALVSEIIVGIYVQIGRRIARCTERPDLVAWAREIEKFIEGGLAARPPREST